MGDALPFASITASSSFLANPITFGPSRVLFLPQNTDLSGSPLHWRPDTADALPWITVCLFFSSPQPQPPLQLDLQKSAVLHRIDVKGDGGSCYVSYFQLRTSPDNSVWSYAMNLSQILTFSANVNGFAVVSVAMPQCLYPVRYVQILPLLSPFGRCLKLDLWVSPLPCPGLAPLSCFFDIFGWSDTQI